MNVKNFRNTYPDQKHKIIESVLSSFYCAFSYPNFVNLHPVGIYILTTKASKSCKSTWFVIKVSLPG